MTTNFEGYMAFKAKVMGHYCALDTYLEGLLNVRLEEFAAMTEDDREQALIDAFEAVEFLARA